MTEAERQLQEARELVETASIHLTRLIECCRYQEERARRWKGATVILLIFCLMLSLLSLSGCLTPAKILRWESALVGWARKGKPECVESAKAASKYLTNANRTLQGATSALDLAADREAKKLMTEAAQKCGEVMP